MRDCDCHACKINLSLKETRNEEITKLKAQAERSMKLNLNLNIDLNLCRKEILCLACCIVGNVLRLLEIIGRLCGFWGLSAAMEKKGKTRYARERKPMLISEARAGLESCFRSVLYLYVTQRR